MHSGDVTSLFGPWLVAGLVGASLSMLAGSAAAGESAELQEGEAAPARHWVAREPGVPPWSVSVSGPALTVLGGALLVAGSAVAASGAWAEQCAGADSESCHGKRIALIAGGMGGGGLLGGLGLGIGTRLWARELGVASESFEEEAPRADSALMGGGIALVVVGSVALGAGFVGSLVGGVQTSLPPKYGYAISGAPSFALLMGGGVATAIGAPMVVLGKRKLPKEQCVIEVAVGAGSVSIDGHF